MKWVCALIFLQNKRDPQQHSLSIDGSVFWNLKTSLYINFMTHQTMAFGINNQYNYLDISLIINENHPIT
jgi:hypothetical protein